MKGWRRDGVVVGTMVLLACALLLAPGCGAAAQPAGPATASPGAPAAPLGVVALKDGRVSGVESGGVSAYLGIPYAAPPVGALRWRPPQPAKPWDGVRACTQYGASCIQGNAPDHPGKDSGAQSEDCLYLNVWTPAKTRHERLPVMVWIHGGGFISGSGALPAPGGTMLGSIEHVIVVSFNYRLGVFGFLAHPQLSQESPHDVSGNYGLLDQMEALRWVRRNIAAFGGDPGRVTIFGQSAGGQSVIAQLVSPLSRGLFSRAASESPRYQDRGIGLWSTLTLEEQEQEGEEIADGLGIPDGPGQAAALRKVSAARLATATAPAPRSLPLMFVQPPQPSFQPVVDGYVLPAEPWKLLRSGKWAHVPLLIGSNQDECNMWLSGLPTPRAASVAEAARQRVQWFAGPDWPGLDQRFPAAPPGSLMPHTSRMMTVLEFNAPARYAARVAAESQRSFLYYFTRVPPGADAGADHGEEVPYVFGRVAARAQKGVTDATDVALSRVMMHYWASFAATGDPNSPGAPTWNAYDPKTDRALWIGPVAAMSGAPYPKACEVAERADRDH